jgi:hypothetical protein
MIRSRERTSRLPKSGTEDRGTGDGDQTQQTTQSSTMAPIAVSPDSESSPATLTTTFGDTLRFYLNGTRVVLDEIDPEITLLEYLRGIGLTGTKL